jgi:hypothetical protein
MQVANAAASGGPITRTGRPEIQPQTAGHHCGPNPAAVTSSATTTNMPPKPHQPVSLVRLTNARVKPKQDSSCE